MITQERLRELLDYDPETGLLTWRVSYRGVQGGVGAEAGGYKDGYRHIGIDGKRYRSHRLIWLYVYGRWPKGSIDHINMDRSDNRLVNLREATHQQNKHNRRKQSNNTSGFKGVSWDKARCKWSARIKANGKYKFLGYFNNPRDAHAAYVAAADKYFGEYARAA